MRAQGGEFNGQWEKGTDVLKGEFCLHTWTGVKESNRKFGNRATRKFLEAQFVISFLPLICLEVLFSNIKATASTHDE